VDIRLYISAESTGMGLFPHFEFAFSFSWTAFDFRLSNRETHSLKVLLWRNFITIWVNYTHLSNWIWMWVCVSVGVSVGMYAPERVFPLSFPFGLALSPWVCLMACPPTSLALFFLCRRTSRVKALRKGKGRKSVHREKRVYAFYQSYSSRNITSHKPIIYYMI